jgi:hypothetical protein
MVGISVENDGRVRVERRIMFPTNLPHIASVEIRLRDAKDNQSRHDSQQLQRH